MTSMSRNLGISLDDFERKDQLSFAAIKDKGAQPIIKKVKAAHSRDTHAILNVTGKNNYKHMTH